MKVLFVSLQILMVVSSWYFDTGIQALSTLNHLHQHHHEEHEHGAHESFTSSHRQEKVVSLTHSHSDEETAEKQSDDETHEHRIPVTPSNSTLYISLVDYHLPIAPEVTFVPDVDEDFLISSHYIQGVFRPPIA